MVTKLFEDESNSIDGIEEWLVGKLLPSAPSNERKYIL